MHLDQHQQEEYNRRLALLHASDHLNRLVEACLEREEPLSGIQVLAAGQRLAPEIAEAGAWLGQSSRDRGELVRHLAEASARQAKERRRHRAQLLEETAAGALPPDETHKQLEAMRWVDRVGYHTWRGLHHLAGAETAGDSQVYMEPENTSGAT